MADFSANQPAWGGVGLVVLAISTAVLGFSCGFGALDESDCGEVGVVVVTLAVFHLVGAFACWTAWMQSSGQMTANWHRPCNLPPSLPPSLPSSSPLPLAVSLADCGCVQAAFSCLRWR